MKESFPCFTVQGPVGPYEVLHAPPIATLFAVELKRGWRMIVGDTAGFHRLAFLAGVMATRHDTAIYLSLRSNPFPEWVGEEAASPGILDLVLAPHHVALRPKEWKALRERKPQASQRLLLPPLERLEAFPHYPFDYWGEHDVRGMDHRVGCATLFLSGDRKTFLSLARSAATIAGSLHDWDACHLDHIMRGSDDEVTLNFWDPRRVPRDSA